MHAACEQSAPNKKKPIIHPEFSATAKRDPGSRPLVSATLTMQQRDSLARQDMRATQKAPDVREGQELRTGASTLNSCEACKAEEGSAGPKRPTPRPGS